MLRHGSPYSAAGGPNEGSPLAALRGAIVQSCGSQRGTPRSFILNLRPASPTPGGSQRPERDWLLEDEPICGLSEAGLTTKFDWREVNCSPAFQQALKELGYESTSCELIGDESAPVAYAFTLESIQRAP